MNNLHTHTKKAFTLIELMVVIAILGILMTVVIGAVGDSQKKARKAAAITGVNQTMKEAVSEYTNDSGVFASDTCARITWKFFGTATSNAVLGLGAAASANVACFMDSTTKDTFPSGAPATFVPTTANYDKKDIALMAKMYDGTMYCADTNGFNGKITPSSFGSLPISGRCQ
jgi:prepilin-type N-terminal cleavage/methylation domain-containing protein